MSNNLFIKLKGNLDTNDFTDINNLKNICIDYDNTYLKLEIDFKLDRDKNNGSTINNINEFMLFDGNKLIGYAGICAFGGIEFIKNITDDYVHSEYDMNLDMAATHKYNFDNLIFRKATLEDVNIITKAGFEFFYQGDIEGIASGTTYLIEIDNAVIGKVRLEVTNNIGGIYGLEILPDYRGKGYGRELLILSINELKRSNVKAIKLQVETKNRNALNLYKSCGFKENYTMNYYRLKR